MVYMTRTDGFYLIYTNIQWNNCNFPTELVQMFQLVNVWNFATIYHLLQCPQSVSAGRSAGTSFTPHCCLPALKCARVHWTEKLATKQPDYAVWGHCSRWCIGVKFQTLTSWNVCLSTVGLSYARTHWIERSISCQKDWWCMVVRAKGAHFEFRLD